MDIAEEDQPAERVALEMAVGKQQRGGCGGSRRSLADVAAAIRIGRSVGLDVMDAIVDDPPQRGRHEGKAPEHGFQRVGDAAMAEDPAMGKLMGPEGDAGRAVAGDDGEQGPGPPAHQPEARPGAQHDTGMDEKRDDARRRRRERLLRQQRSEKAHAVGVRRRRHEPAAPLTSIRVSSRSCSARLAVCRSTVSKPSVNRPSTSCRRWRASSPRGLPRISR